MNRLKLGILHPGNMGISIAASAQNSDCDVYWASEGRSAKTRERADRFALQDAGTLAHLSELCQILVSVCPPHAAEDVADQVLSLGYSGIYVDANAISPQRSIRIGEKMTKGGIAFVDGGIIGGPAWEPDSTWLYLCGEHAHDVMGCFAAGPLETSNMGTEIGKASAIKMCYAAWTKGSTALLTAILGTAEVLNVKQELLRQWAWDWPGFDEQAIDRARRVTSKAWRFVGEMEEISATFEEAGLPSEFHAAAADIYRRLAGFKDAPSIPPIDDVLSALRQ